MGARTVLVTGAAGYVGARLVPRLLARGWRVRAASRSIGKLRSRPWAARPGVELAAMDVLDAASLRRACAGCAVAYYLVHSMTPGQCDFTHADREGAANMARAGEEAGLARIIYLGGLGGGPEAPMSAHLRSRAEVGEVLASGRVPVTVLKAAMVIGAGSGSFEILRYLVDRLPLMLTPRWVATESQPIAVRNVLDYLEGCLDAPETAGGSFDIGGPEVVTYRRLMELYAEEAGLPRRWIVPVPVLTPRLSSYWIDLVTPAPASLARPLAEGLASRLVCADDRIRALVPVGLLDCRTAIRAAVGGAFRKPADPGGQGGVPPPEEGIQPGDPDWTGGTEFVDRRRIVLSATRDDVWRAIGEIGGRKGGRDPVAGEAVGRWRVDSVDAGRRLALVAETTFPGFASRTLLLREVGQRATEVRQVSRFRPRGLSGLLSGYAAGPIRHLASARMLRGLARRLGKAALAGPERAGEGTPV